MRDKCNKCGIDLCEDQYRNLFCRFCELDRFCELEQERDALRAIVDALEFERVDEMIANGAEFCKEVGMEAANRTKRMKARVVELEELVEVVTDEANAKAIGVEEYITMEADLATAEKIITIQSDDIAFLEIDLAKAEAKVAELEETQRQAFDYLMAYEEKIRTLRKALEEIASRTCRICESHCTATAAAKESECKLGEDNSMFCPRCCGETYATFTITGEGENVDIIRCPCGYMEEKEE